MTRASRRWSLFLLMVILTAFGLRWWRNGGRGEEGADLEPFYTRAADRGEIRLEVSATGTLNPVNQVEVGAQITGRVAALHADFNDRVEEGELIAQLDDTFLRASLEEARANLVRARAEARQKEKDLERATTLAARNLISQQELEVARTSYEVARASVRQSEAALARSETNLAYATIVSPVSGVVIDRQVDVGQTVAASLQAPVLFLIAEDLTRMQLETAIDEADIGRIREGQPVDFTVDAYPDERFDGVVSQVRLAPQVVQNVTTYAVIIDVENPDLKLRPGMTANVTITVAERSAVLRIPSAALRFRPATTEEAGAEPGAVSAGAAAGPGGMGRRFRDMSPEERERALESMSPEMRERIRARMTREQGPVAGKSSGDARRGTIHVWKDGQARAVPVRLGLDNGTWVEILGGPLEEGDAVITGTRRPEGERQKSAGLFDMSRFRSRRRR